MLPEKAGMESFLFCFQRLFERANGFISIPSHVMIQRRGSISRMPKYQDKFGRREEWPQGYRCAMTGEINMRCFPDQCLFLYCIKKTEIRDGIFNDLKGFTKKTRLLYRRHENIRMIFQMMIKRSGSAFCCTQDKKIGQVCTAFNIRIHYQALSWTINTMTKNKRLREIKTPVI